MLLRSSFMEQPNVPLQGLAPGISVINNQTRNQHCPFTMTTFHTARVCSQQNVHHRKLCTKFAYGDELVMTAHRCTWRSSHCPDQQRTFVRRTYCRDMSDNKLAGSPARFMQCRHWLRWKSILRMCHSAFEQDKNWHIKCCQAEHCRWPGNKHIQTGAMKQSTDVTPATSTCSVEWQVLRNSGNEHSAIVHCTDAKLASPQSAELQEYQTWHSTIYVRLFVTRTDNIKLRQRQTE